MKGRCPMKKLLILLISVMLCVSMVCAETELPTEPPTEGGTITEETMPPVPPEEGEEMPETRPKHEDNPGV